MLIGIKAPDMEHDVLRTEFCMWHRRLNTMSERNLLSCETVNNEKTGSI